MRSAVASLSRLPNLSAVLLKASQLARRHSEEVDKVLQSKQSSVDMISVVVRHLRLVMDLGESAAKVSRILSSRGVAMNNVLITKINHFAQMGVGIAINAFKVCSSRSSGIMVLMHGSPSIK